jgi:hypothetical protein
MTTRLLDESGAVLLDESGNVLGDESYDAYSGSGSPSVSAATTSGSGAVGRVGSGSFSLPAVTTDGAGAVAFIGTGALSVPAATGSGSGVVERVGTGTPVVGSVEASASGVVERVGSGAPSGPAVTASVAAKVSRSGAGALSVGAVTASGAGVVDRVGAGAPALWVPTTSGAGVMERDGTGAPSLPVPETTGTGKSTKTGTGTPSFPVATTEGDGGLQWDGTGTPSVADVPFIQGLGKPKKAGIGTPAVASVPTVTAVATKSQDQWRGSNTETIEVPVGLGSSSLVILFDLAVRENGGRVQDESGDDLLDESDNPLHTGGGLPDVVVPDGFTQLESVDDTASYNARFIVSYAFGNAIQATSLVGMQADTMAKVLVCIASPSGIHSVTKRQADAISEGTGALANTSLPFSSWSEPMVGIAAKAVTALTGSLDPTLATSSGGGFDEDADVMQQITSSPERAAVEVNHIDRFSGGPHGNVTVTTADDGDWQAFVAFILEIVTGATGTAEISAPVPTTSGIGGRSRRSVSLEIWHDRVIYSEMSESFYEFARHLNDVVPHMSLNASDHLGPRDVDMVGENNAAEIGGMSNMVEAA